MFGDPGCPIHSKGDFCDNIRVFLQECGQLHDVVVKGMPAWCTLLVHDTRKFLVPIYTIEENVVCSPKPYCNHCRCAGRSSSECLAATVECDICEVWQHTCCSGIEDTEAVPPLFVCSGCCSSLILSSKNESSCAFERSGTLLMPTETYGLELGY